MKYKEIYRMNCLIGNRNSGRMLLMKVLPKGVGETWCRAASIRGTRFGQAQCIYALSEGSELWNMFEEDQNNKGILQVTRSCPERKIPVISLLQTTKNSKWRKWIAEQSSICRGGTRLGNPVVTVLPVQTKTLQETQNNLMKFLEPTRKPKVIYADNSLEFGKSCEEFSWNHCTSTPHRSETNGVAERAVRRVKERTSAVLLQSGLDNEWWSDSMKCYCYLRNIPDKHSDGKIPYERRFGMPFNGPVIPFAAMVERPIWTASVRLKSLARYFSRSCTGKETSWSQTLKNWSRWTHLNSTPEGSMQRMC